MPNIENFVSPFKIEDVQLNPAVPKFYANGFGCGHSLTDASIVFQFSSATTALVTMPFAAIKTLRDSLSDLIKEIEKGLDEPIPDLKQLNIEWQKNKMTKAE